MSNPVTESHVLLTGGWNQYAEEMGNVLEVGMDLVFPSPDAGYLHFNLKLHISVGHFPYMFHLVSQWEIDGC